MASSTDTSQTLRRLGLLFKLERKEITNLYVFAIVVGLFSLAVPLGVQALIGMISGGLLLQPAILLIIFVVAGSAFTGYLQWLQVAVIERIQQRIFVRSAFQFAHRIPRWRLESLGTEYSGEIPNKFFDVLNIQKGIGKVLMDYITAILQFFFGLLLLTFYHPYFIAFGLVMVLLLFSLFRFLGPLALKTSLVESKYKYKVAFWLQNLGRVLPHQRLQADALSRGHTDEVVAGYLRQRQAHFRTLQYQYLGLFVFKTLVIAGLLLMGSLLVVDRQINLGQFVASELIIVMILAAVEKLVLNLDTVYDLLTGLEKVGQVTDIPIQRESYFECLPDQPKTGIAIRAEGLSLYSAEGIRLLDEANFQVKPGEKVGLLAEDPEVARNLLQLFEGVRDEYQGLVSIDGFGLRELTPASLATQVAGAVSAQAIFPGSMAENLSPDGRTHDISHLQPLLATLSLFEAIERLPGGLAQPLLPGGLGLDPRVAARVVLARAIGANPRLLLIHLLLDAQPQIIKRQLIEFLFAPERTETLLITSYDPQVLLACNRVLVLRGGRLVNYTEPREALTIMEDQLLEPIPHPDIVFDRPHVKA